MKLTFTVVFFSVCRLTFSSISIKPCSDTYKSKRKTI